MRHFPTWNYASERCAKAETRRRRFSSCAGHSFVWSASRALAVGDRNVAGDASVSVPAAGNEALPVLFGGRYFDRRWLLSSRVYTGPGHVGYTLRTHLAEHTVLPTPTRVRSSQGRSGVSTQRNRSRAPTSTPFVSSWQGNCARIVTALPPPGCRCGSGVAPLGCRSRTGCTVCHRSSPTGIRYYVRNERIVCYASTLDDTRNRHADRGE